MQNNFEKNERFLSFIKSKFSIFEPLETQRKLYISLGKKIKKICFLLTFILTLLSFKLIAVYDNGIFLFFAVFLGVIPYVIYRFKVNLFLKRVHFEIIPLIFNFFKEGVVTNSFITKDIILKSGLFRYADHVRTPFGFCFKHEAMNCLVQESVIINNMGPRWCFITPQCLRKYQYSYQCPFKGIFIYCELNKSFEKHTLILNQQNMFSHMLQNSSICNMEAPQILEGDFYQLSLVDDYFNHYFKIFSTQPDLEDKENLICLLMFLNRLKKQFNTPRIDVSFFENKVLLAMHTDVKFFQFLKIEYSFLDERLFLKFYENVAELLNIILLLNEISMTNVKKISMENED